MPKKQKERQINHIKAQKAIATDGGAQKPTARALVGGESWTGKLPVNMLSEYCQKNKWEKPDYSMVYDLQDVIRVPKVPF